MNHRQSEIVGIIILVILILIPFIWITYSHPAKENFSDTLSARMIKDEIEKAGLGICNESEERWNLSGALGGNTYTISSDCNDPGQSLGVSIYTQKFATYDDRNAAIRSFNSQNHRGKPNGVLLLGGQYIVLVQGNGHGKVAALLNNITTTI